MSQVDEVDYQDPILTPGNLRKIVESLPSKAKHQHTDYEYNANSDTFENEINEFFKHTEITVQLQEYRRLYEKEFSINDFWQDNNHYRSQHIIVLINEMDYTEPEVRLQSCQHLAYISLGLFTTDINETSQHRTDNMVSNNNLLLQCGALPIFFQKLQQSCGEYHLSSQQTEIGICAEIDLYLTLIYVLLESQRFQQPSNSTEKLQNELALMDPNLPEFLCSLLAKLGEKQDKIFPVKKTILLLWKSLLFLSGGLERIKESTGTARSAIGLSTPKDIITKCTPQEYSQFHDEITSKYPGYILPNFPFDVTTPSLTINASTALSKAMGYNTATDNVELLYQTLFPPKTSSNALNDVKKQLQTSSQLQNYFMPASPAFVLPLTHSGSDVPESIKEAERSNGIQKWKQQKEGHSVDTSLDFIEQLYAKVISDLQNIIIVFLKLLLSAVTAATTTKGQDEIKPSSITLEYIEEVDIVRDREIYSKAISGILMILLKWTKSSHVLKFEYLSQLLADSGCLLLILKIIGLQDISDLVKVRTDIPYYGFFDYNVNREANEDEIQPEKVYTNRRNLYSIINYLRILQMLTKHKTHRITLLVQYKSSAILKRLLKISHPLLELYVLKILKSQIPYLGRKWRSRKSFLPPYHSSSSLTFSITENMKIISNIYLQCHTTLNDDWISKANSEVDVEEGKMEENNLRILTLVYNGERYLPSLLPVHDEINTTNNAIPTGPGLNGFIHYDLGELNQDQIYLDPDFGQNYRSWLEAEVFSEQEDAAIQCCIDAPTLHTPYPLEEVQNSFSHEELTYEINKLYTEQMNKEFQPTPPITVEKKKDDEWESPPVPRKLTPLARYNGDENSLVYVRSRETHIDFQEQEVEEEVLLKLIEVEEETVKKWYSSNGDEKNRYHFKMDLLYDEDLYYTWLSDYNSNIEGGSSEESGQDEFNN